MGRIGDHMRWLTRLGTEGLDADTVRRVRILNHISTILALFGIVFVVICLLAGSEDAALIAIVPGTGCAVVPALNARGLYRFTRHALPWWCSTWLLAFSAAFGPASGMHYLYFGLLVLPYLVLPGREWVLGVVHFLVPLAMLIACAQGVVPSPFDLAPSPSLLMVMQVASATFTFLLIVGPLVSSQFMYSKAERDLLAANDELRAETRARMETELELESARRLEAIGQLAAGVAHEINTPCQFISDNVEFLESGLERMSRYIVASNEALEAAPEQARRDVAKAAKRLKLSYVQKQLPRALTDAKEGAERVAEIVAALKSFSHPSRDKAPADLNRVLQNVAAVSRHEWKLVAEMVLDLDPQLPEVDVCASEIRQALLNLTVNAAHAVGEASGESRDPSRRGKITLRSRLEQDHVTLEVVDTGAGIPQEIADRVFDPFFTTKPVGKGTGQGLGIAHRAVVTTHGGKLRFERGVDGVGTRFIVELPLQTPAPQTERVAS